MIEGAAAAGAPTGSRRRTRGDGVGDQREVSHQVAIRVRGKRVARRSAHFRAALRPIHEIVSGVRFRDHRHAVAVIEGAAATGASAGSRRRTRGDVVGDRREVGHQIAIRARGKRVAFRSAHFRAAFRPVDETVPVVRYRNHRNAGAVIERPAATGAATGGRRRARRNDERNGNEGGNQIHIRLDRERVHRIRAHDRGGHRPVQETEALIGRSDNGRAGAADIRTVAACGAAVRRRCAGGHVISRHEVRHERAIRVDGKRVYRGCAHLYAVFGPIHERIAGVMGRHYRHERPVIVDAVSGRASSFDRRCARGNRACGSHNPRNRDRVFFRRKDGIGKQILGINGERKDANRCRRPGEDPRKLVKRRSVGKRSGRRGMEGRIGSRNHHGPIGIRNVEFAVRNVIDQSQDWGDIETGHLGAEELADHLNRRKIGRYRNPFAGVGVDMVVIRNTSNAMYPVSGYLIRHRLTRFRIDRSCVLVELVTARDDLIAAREVFRHSRQHPFGISSVGKFGLENPPFRFHLGRLAVCPIGSGRVIGVGVDKLPEFHLVGIMSRRLDVLDPRGFSELEYRRSRRRRRNDHCLNLRQGLRGSRRIVGEGGRRDIDRRPMDQVARPVVDQPVVLYRGRRAVIAHAEMFAPKVYGRIGKLVAIGRANGT